MYKCTLFKRNPKGGCINYLILEQPAFYIQRLYFKGLNSYLSGCSITHKKKPVVIVTKSASVSSFLSFLLNCSDASDISQSVFPQNPSNCFSGLKATQGRFIHHLQIRVSHLSKALVSNLCVSWFPKGSQSVFCRVAVVFRRGGHVTLDFHCPSWFPSAHTQLPSSLVLLPSQVLFIFHCGTLGHLEPTGVVLSFSSNRCSSSLALVACWLRRGTGTGNSRRQFWVILKTGRVGAICNSRERIAPTRSQHWKGHAFPWLPVSSFPWWVHEFSLWGRPQAQGTFLRAETKHVHCLRTNVYKQTKTVTSKAKSSCLSLG